MSRMLGRIPLFHVFVNGARPVIGKLAFDLESLVVFCHEEDRSLASLQNIALGFVKKIIGHNQSVVAELTDTCGVDGIRPAILVNGNQDNGAIAVVPGFD